MTTEQVVNWPDGLVRLVETVLPAPWDVERLGGMSESRVYRVRNAGASLIAKVSPSSAEHTFYSTYAPSLRDAGVGMPELLAAVEFDGFHSLLLEDLPHTLVVRRDDAWQPDRRVLETLARLHTTTQEWLVGPGTPTTWSWTEAMTQALLDNLAAGEARRLSGPLNALAAEAQVLFEPECWISGDPNPLNWGVRDDGSVALFDWELFGPGATAIDLAVTVPGLGDRTAYRLTAVEYAGVRKSASGATVDSLARQIALAKIASVVGLVHGSVTGTARVSDGLLEWIREQFPALVEDVYGKG